MSDEVQPVRGSNCPATIDAPSRTGALSIVLRPYQVRGIEKAEELYRQGYRRILLQLPTGGGKCLGRGTPVLFYDGRVVAVEDVRAGDTLMGPDSQPRRVLSTNAGRGPLYRVTPVKGDPWVCNDAHILTLVDTVTGAVEDIDVTTYLTRSKTYRHTRKLFSPPAGIDFAPAPTLPLDPYFLGVWFGDGSHRTDQVAVSKPDPEIAALMQETAARYGLSVRTDRSYNGCPTHHIRGERGAGNPLLNLLREVVGREMTVPHAYLTASRRDRLALLAGFLDTDGYLHNGSYEIVQLRRDYADAIAMLARGLGFRVLISQKIVNDKAYQRLSISGETSQIPMRIARKIAAPRLQKKCATRTGFSLLPLGPGEYFGFTLDGDGRFLLGDCTVTHNTVVAARFLSGAVAKGKRALFLAHRREIVSQSFAKLYQDGVPLESLGCLMADGVITHPVTGKQFKATNPNAQVIVASVATWTARPSKPPADVVFIDEAHHCGAKTWRAIIDYYVERGAVVIGLTATPCRGDGKGLADLFDVMHCIEKMSALVAGGFLCEAEVYVGQKKIKGLSELKVRHGDYEPGELEKLMMDDGLVANIIEQWKKHSGGRTTVVFAAGVEHSLTIAQRFRDAGVTAEHIDGKTETEVRDAVMARLASGETQVVCNAMVLTEGWDLPRCKMVVLARPTKSKGLYLQMVGRCLRPWEGVVPIVLDHSSTARRFGSPSKDRYWALEGDREKKEDAESAQCESCGFMLAVGQRVCPKCGAEEEVEERQRAERSLEEQEGEMVKLVGPSAEELLRRAKDRSRKQTVKDQAVLLANEEARRAVNKEIGWVARDISTRYGAKYDLVLTEINRTIYRRIGNRSRTTASCEVLEQELAWLQRVDPTTGERVAVTSIVHRMGLKLRDAGAAPKAVAPRADDFSAGWLGVLSAPPVPMPKAPGPVTSTQLSLLGIEAPPAPKPKVPSAPVAPTTPAAPAGISRSMMDAMDRAEAAHRARKAALGEDDDDDDLFGED